MGCRRGALQDATFHSRLTYAAQPGAITALCAAEDDRSLASASASGSVHVWRVEYTLRASGLPDKYTGPHLLFVDDPTDMS